MDNQDLLNLARELPGGQDLADAVEAKDIELMTYGELGEALGVVTRENGYDGVEFFNACINCQTNPKVTTLPRGERLRIIKTSVAALDNMRSL